MVAWGDLFRMIKVTMDRFLEMLFSDTQKSMDLWWGTHGRVGAMQGQLIHVVDFDELSFARMLAARLGGFLQGLIVEIPQDQWKTVSAQPWAKDLMLHRVQGVQLRCAPVRAEA